MDEGLEIGDERLESREGMQDGRGIWRSGSRKVKELREDEW
jgi:hypothetical protein